MKASGFIAGKLQLKGRIAMVSIAVSFLVMIVAISVTSGFRKELRSGISSVFGDVQLTAGGGDYTSDESVLSVGPWLDRIADIPYVKRIVPAVYKAGIIKNGENIQGAVFKGTEGAVDSLNVLVPSSMAAKLSVNEGDKLTVYFAGEKVRVRRFTVSGIYPAIMGGDDKLVVMASLEAMRSVCGLDSTEVSAVEIILDGSANSPEFLHDATEEIGAKAYAYSEGAQAPPVATSTLNRFPQVYSWLDLLDVNVLLVLALMTVVAGFNMISGLLISLFRNISTIGILKAVGMMDRSIAAAFLRSASKLVLKGMLIGNVLGIGLCLLQGATHALKLDPENYFISYVPVNLDFIRILATDAVAFCVILLMLLLPSLFISGVDPAKTIKVR